MKKNILFMIFGMFLVGVIGIGVYAINASSITYKETTVEGAIDDLYSKASNSVLNKFVGRVRVIAGSNTVESVGNFGLYGSNVSGTNYKYFKITALNDTNDTTAYCNVKGWSNAQAKSIALELNTEYEICSDTDGYRFTEINVYTKSTTEGKTGRCQAVFELYNK